MRLSAQGLLTLVRYAPQMSRQGLTLLLLPGSLDMLVFCTSRVFFWWPELRAREQPGIVRGSAFQNAAAIAVRAQ